MDLDWFTKVARSITIAMWRRRAAMCAAAKSAAKLEAEIIEPAAEARIQAEREADTEAIRKGAAGI